MVEINFADEPANVVAARKAAWAAQSPAPLPLDAEELFEMLKSKGVVGDVDRPRPKPPG